MKDTPRTAALRRYKRSVENAEAVLTQIAYEGHLSEATFREVSLHLRNARRYAPDPDIVLEQDARSLA